MSFNKRSLMKSLLKSKGACGCRPKPSHVFNPTPKPKISIYQQNTNPSSRNSSTTTTSTAADEDFTPTPTPTTVSEPDTTTNTATINNKKQLIPKPSPKLIDSVAVEKDSKDPHKDFRNSMFQMIFEREIYSES